MRTPPRPTWIAAISAAVLVASVAAARADGGQAEAKFEEGNKLMAAGKLGEACAAFEASNAAEARAGTLIRLGECREQNHQLASAYEAFKAALARVKDPKKKQIASAKIAELEPRLSKLTIDVGDAGKLTGITIARDGQPLAHDAWGTAVRLDGGSHVITAHAPGHDDWTKTVEVPEASGAVIVEVPPLAETKLVVAASTPVAADSPKHVDEPEPSSRWTGKRKAAVVLAGVAVLGAAGGTYFGLHASSKRNEALGDCPSGVMACASQAMADAANAANADARSAALDANIGFAVAGAAAIAAGVLWVIGAPEHGSGVALAPHLAPGLAALSFEGRF